jgi:hypothetical protein
LWAYPAIPNVGAAEAVAVVAERVVVQGFPMVVQDFREAQPDFRVEQDLVVRVCAVVRVCGPVRPMAMVQEALSVPVDMWAAVVTVAIMVMADMDVVGTDGVAAVMAGVAMDTDGVWALDLV